MTSGRETENGERELIRQPSCYDCSSRSGVEEEPDTGSGVEEKWEGYIRERAKRTTTRTLHVDSPGPSA